MLCGVSLLAPLWLEAMPYATCLTNHGGVVSFRLNQTTTTNDCVLVISGGGAVTNALQLPGTSAETVLGRGLVMTNLGIAGPFKVQVQHVSSGQMSAIGPSVAFNSPRGLDVNNHPASPYFGWVYVANSAAGTRGDGLFAFSADLADTLGQGTAARTGGYPYFTSSGSSSPWNLSVAPDDSVLVCDWSDSTGNLIALEPQLTSFQYVLQPLSGAAVVPVGSNNVHGSVTAAMARGSSSAGDLVIFTVDEDYQSDPNTTGVTELNSLWRYNIGSGSIPWSSPPQKLMTPVINFVSQTCQVAGRPAGYLYVSDSRANGYEPCLYIVDPDHPVDPSSYAGNPGGYFWDSRTESLAEGWDRDLLSWLGAITVSPDGAYLAGISYGTSPAITNAASGIAVTNRANDLLVFPLTNGIPDLARERVFRGLGTNSAGRGIAFDAAHNLYAISSGGQLLQAVDLGESATAITSSEGTFTLLVNHPPQAASLSAATIQNQPITIAKAKLLALANDPDGDPLALTMGASATSTNGGSVVAGAEGITYTPVAGYIGSDRFSYTVLDNRGGSTSAFVFVQVRPGDVASANMLPLVSIPGGYLVTFAGVPGRTYSLQRSAAASGPWSTLTTVTVGPSGIGSYTDINSPPAHAFYRTTYP